MALAKTVYVDKTEVVSAGSTYATNDWKNIQVRTATVIKEDGVEIEGSRSFCRYTLDPGTLDASDNLVDNPLDKEPDDVTPIPDDIKGMCNILWTDSIKSAWKAHLITLKPSS